MSMNGSVVKKVGRLEMVARELKQLRKELRLAAMYSTEAKVTTYTVGRYTVRKHQRTRVTWRVPRA